jgi:3-oxoadipate enol-lactonase
MADVVKLHYSEAGQGPAVVLLHGFPLSSAIWREQQRALSDRFRVIAPDLRGHGQSPAPAGPYAMAALAQDVLALLDALQVHQSTIVGHSMGGYVALAALKQAPERFAALGLVASQTAADSAEARQNRQRLAERVAKEGSKAVAETMVPRLFAPDLAPDSPIIAAARDLMLATPPAGIIGVLQAMAARADATELLRHLRMPILLLAGARDQVIAVDKARAMAALNPLVKLETIEGAGHMPMLEQPQATTEVLRKFLQPASGAR